MITRLRDLWVKKEREIRNLGIMLGSFVSIFKKPTKIIFNEKMIVSNRRTFIKVSIRVFLS